MPSGVTIHESLPFSYGWANSNGLLRRAPSFDPVCATIKPRQATTSRSDRLVSVSTSGQGNSWPMWGGGGKCGQNRGGLADRGCAGGCSVSPGLAAQRSEWRLSVLADGAGRRAGSSAGGARPRSFRGIFGSSAGRAKPTYHQRAPRARWQGAGCQPIDPAGRDGCPSHRRNVL